MIDHNHPAVEAAARVALHKGWTCEAHEPLPWGDCLDCTESHLRTAPAALTAALPHLESVTEENLARLRNTPAGRVLMAQTLREAGKDLLHGDPNRASESKWLHIRATRLEMELGNPYLETPNE